MNSVFSPAGPFAGSIATLGWALFIGASVIFIGVMGLLAWALRRGGAQVSTARWVFGGGLVMPVVVLAVLMFASAMVGGRMDIQSLPRDALVVEVTGKMWWWEVRYRVNDASGSAGTVEVVLANEIRIPVGRPVYLGLTTSDVIHSFWVPRLAGKMDMVPGRVNRLVVQADAEGVYRGQCAEYCGEQHARMALHVVAMAPAGFEQWLASQARPASVPADPLALQGQQQFIAQRCVSCHTVRGLSESSRLGPDLTHVGSRLYLGAGMLQNHRQALIRWTSDVQQLKPGARMPSFDRLDAGTLDAIGAYLSQLK